jgi:hypothetical protein
MRRSVAIAVIALALVAASCGDGGRHTEPVDIPDHVEGTVYLPEPFRAPLCLLAHGTGVGAEVLTVDPSSPAALTIFPGDVITEADGVVITSGAELTAVVRSKEVGEVLQLKVVRPGEDAVDTPLEVVGRPDNRTAPATGLRVRTAVEMVDSRLLDPTASIDSPQSVVVSVEGRLLALDPVTGTWLDLNGPTPPTRWVPANGGVYVLEPGAPDRVVSVAGVASGFDFVHEDWRAQVVLGAQGGLVLVRADRSTDTGPESTLFAIDPATGDLAWEYRRSGSAPGEHPVPIMALSSVSATRTLVGTTVFDDAGDTGPFSFVVVDQAGRTLPGSDELVPPGARVMGWYSDNQIAYLTDIVGEIVLVNVDTGSLDQLIVPVPAEDVTFSPVGDGSHMFLLSAGRIDLISTGPNASFRPLATDCGVDALSHPGFVG